MFYDEAVIDGVLCWRGTPNGEWIAKTQQQLTQMLIEARRENISPQKTETEQPQRKFVGPGELQRSGYFVGERNESLPGSYRA